MTAGTPSKLHQNALPLPLSPTGVMGGNACWPMLPSATDEPVGLASDTTSILCPRLIKYSWWLSELYYRQRCMPIMQCATIAALLPRPFFDIQKMKQAEHKTKLYRTRKNYSTTHYRYLLSLAREKPVDTTMRHYNKTGALLDRHSISARSL